MTVHVAIIGSGPSGYYTAEALQKQFPNGVCIDIIDRLPTPFGLIRAGVAPDHQSIKAVSRRFTETALTDNVRFVGNLEIGEAVEIDELRSLYHAVIIATGAPSDRKLGVAGEDLPGVFGSAAFVGWYNGHPDYANLTMPLDCERVAIIGNGNVALDVARVLAKTAEEFTGSDIVSHARMALAGSRIRDIHIIGRRGPHQVSFTPKELGEMAHLSRAAVSVRSADLPPLFADETLDPGQRKVMTLLRGFAGTTEADRSIRIHFDFWQRPLAITGQGRVESLRLATTELKDGQVVDTGAETELPCGLVVACIGYRTHPIHGVPYDPVLGRFVSDEGVIGAGLYCVGWARRGPTGTIGTNRPDGFMIAEKVAATVPQDVRPGRRGLDALIEARDLPVVTFRDWQRIDSAEVARAGAGQPREKFVAIEEMLARTRE